MHIKISHVADGYTWKWHCCRHDLHSHFLWIWKVSEMISNDNQNLKNETWNEESLLQICYYFIFWFTVIESWDCLWNGLPKSMFCNLLIYATHFYKLYKMIGTIYSVVHSQMIMLNIYFLIQIEGWMSNIFLLGIISLHYQYSWCFFFSVRHYLLALSILLMFFFSVRHYFFALSILLMFVFFFQLGIISLHYQYSWCLFFFQLGIISLHYQYSWCLFFSS